MKTPDVRSRTMRAVKGKDTKPEWIVRRLLHAAGYRYRLHASDLPGKPDLVFPAQLRCRVPLHLRPGPRDNGFCESVLFWHIGHGHYGDINLDGLSFVRVGRWEGDLWAGRPRGRPASSLTTAPTSAKRKCSPAFSAAKSEDFRLSSPRCSPKAGRCGVERARITFEIAPDRAKWGTEIAGKVKAWARALTGPTSLPGLRTGVRHLRRRCPLRIVHHKPGPRRRAGRKSA
jgi:hypothetical protein